MKSNKSSGHLSKLFFNNPIGLFIIFSIGCLLIVWLLDRYSGNSFFEGVLAEAHGLVLDLIVFGILITIYQNISDKRSKIDRYIEEIDDYRYWKSPESTIRIVGNTKRLIRLGITKIDFSYSYLDNANFDFYRSLDKVMKTGKDHKGRKSWYAKEIEKSLKGSDFSNCSMVNANLSNTELSDCSFRSTNLTGASFAYCDLRGSDFTGATVTSLAIDGAKVEPDWFDRIRPQNVVGLENLEHIYIVLQNENVYGRVIDYSIHRRENIDEFIQTRQRQRLVELGKKLGKKK